MVKELIKKKNVSFKTFKWCSYRGAPEMSCILMPSVSMRLKQTIAHTAFGFYASPTYTQQPPADPAVIHLSYWICIFSSRLNLAISYCFSPKCFGLICFICLHITSVYHIRVQFGFYKQNFKYRSFWTEQKIIKFALLYARSKTHKAACVFMNKKQQEVIVWLANR